MNESMNMVWVTTTNSDNRKKKNIGECFYGNPNRK